MASIFSHRLELRLLFEGGFYSRAASINASKLSIDIIINTGNLFLTASLTGRHVDLPILRSYVPRYDSETGLFPSQASSVEVLYSNYNSSLVALYNSFVL